MGVFEAIKDLFGVFDDAEDFTDAIKKKVRAADVILGKFEDANSDIQKRVGRLNDRTDAKEAAAILDKLDFRSPFLFGRTLLQRLKDIQDDLGELQRKLRKMPPKIQSEVAPSLNKAQQHIQSTIKENVGALQQISRLQQQRKDRVRTIAKTLVVVGAGTLAAVGLAYVASQAIREAARLSIGGKGLKSAARELDHIPWQSFRGGRGASSENLTEQQRLDLLKRFGINQ